MPPVEGQQWPRGGFADIAALQAQIDELFTTVYEPVTDGDLSAPEIIFADGDVVMAKVMI